MMNKAKFLSRVLVFASFLTCGMSNGEEGNKGQVLPRSEETSVWFIAFEEAEFIRKEIGDWIPIAILQTNDDIPIHWGIEYVNRKESECEAAISFGKEGKEMITQKFSWYDSGDDGNVNYGPFESKAKEVFIPIKQHDGTIRRIWIKCARDIHEIRNSVKISKAMLRWKWEDISPISL